MRYWLFQIPEFLGVAGLASLLAWSEILSWGWLPVALLACGVKNAVIYPWVRHGYVSDASRYVGPERLLDSRGVVSETLCPRGYVWICGELWQAESAGGTRLLEGTAVRVQEVNGLRLLVSAESDPPVPGASGDGEAGPRPGPG